MGAANAYVIDFESVDQSGLQFGPNVVTDQEYVTQGNYGIGAYDPNNSGAPNGSLVASMMNAADATCVAACPSGNPSNFFGSVNDGVVFAGALDGSTVNLTGFDAAFISGGGTGSVYLVVEGDRDDHSYTYAEFLLPAIGTGGSTSFASFAIDANTQYAGGTGTFADAITELYFYAIYCDGSCSLFSTDRGQFALDNIALATTAVPEPSEWLLMALGLGAVGTSVRRRRSV
jgi:hypothetical protein